MSETYTKQACIHQVLGMHSGANSSFQGWLTVVNMTLRQLSTHESSQKVHPMFISRSGAVLSTDAMNSARASGSAYDRAPGRVAARHTRAGTRIMWEGCVKSVSETKNEELRSRRTEPFESVWKKPLYAKTARLNLMLWNCELPRN